MRERSWSCRHGWFRRELGEHHPAREVLLLITGWHHVSCDDVVAPYAARVLVPRRVPECRHDRTHGLASRVSPQSQRAPSGDTFVTGNGLHTGAQ